MNTRPDLPKYVRNIEGPAVDPYHWVLKHSLVSKEAKQLIEDGWKMYPAGPRHIVVWKPEGLGYLETGGTA